MIKNSEKILDLIACAKNGDIDARNELWTIYEDVIRKAHEFSRMGYRCGHVSAKATRFKDGMGRLFDVFMNAIRRYNPDLSSFATFLSNEVKLRAMDKVREKPPVEIPGGDLGGNDADGRDDCSDDGDDGSNDANTSSTLEGVMDSYNEGSSKNGSPRRDMYRTETDADIADANIKAETLKRRYNSEAESDDSTGHNYYASETDAERKIRRLINLYPEGNARRNYLEAYLQAARECDGMGKDPKTKRICEILGCTRANCSSLAKAIRQDGLKRGIILRLLA